MKDTMQLVRLLITAQMLTTVFLAVLLWTLHIQLRRQEFNRWWTCAWVMTALFFSVGRLAMAVPPAWAITKGTLTLLATLFGSIVGPALVFGAVSLESPGRITRRTAIAWCASAAALGVVSFAVSLRWWAEPQIAFSIRNGPRTLVLAVALFYSAGVFVGRFRAVRSYAALLTGVCCLLYGVNQCVYTAAEIAQVSAPRIAPQRDGLSALLWSARFLYADVVITCGIALGMVLLLVEEYQRSERALVETARRRHEVTEQNTALQVEIRHRKEVETKLRDSEDRYRDLVDNSDDLLCTHDLEGRLLSCNPAPARILGYDVEELLEVSIRDILAPDVRDRFERYLRIIQRDGVAKGIMKVITRGGEVRLWRYRNTLRADGVPKPIVRGMARDVTEQFRAEQARRALLARHEAILRALPDWVFMTTGDGVLLDFRARDTQHLVLPPHEFIGRRVTEVLPPDVAGRLVECFRGAMLSDKPSTLEYSTMSGDEERYYEVRSVRADQSQVLSLVRDVTDQKRAEQRVRDLQAELAHASRVAAIGTLAGSLAHEINQPLAATQTNAFVALKMLDMASPDIDAAREALTDIISDNRRIDDVIRRLRGLLRKEQHAFAPVDVNAVVRDVLPLARSNFIERRISVDVRLGSNVPAVLGDRVQLQQVVLNLLMNAADAIDAGSGEDRSLTVTTAAANGQVSVSIADHGGGISDAGFARLFEPFFTTKRNGMGLGLSICRAIIEAHGGQISARRNADRGLTCWFVLDAVAPAVADIPAVSASMVRLPVRDAAVGDRIEG